jgi:hypothetical protein
LFQVSTLGELAGGEFQWHGGVISKVNGAIYGFPAHSDAVLKIQPETGEVSTIGDCRIEGFRCGPLLVVSTTLRLVGGLKETELGRYRGSHNQVIATLCP